MDQTSEIRFGPFRLLGLSGPLLRDEQQIKLQPKATALLWMLARQPGVVVTKSTLMDALWPGAIVGDDALTFQVQALRRAIETDPGDPQYLMTVHRVGFRLDAPKSPDTQVSSTPFVGRIAELESLHAMYLRACAGQRQIAFISGEAGIGKSTLLEHFIAKDRKVQHQAFFGQCVEQRGSHEAFLPILEALERLVRAAPDDRVIQLLQRHAPTWLLQMPGLMEPAEYAKLKQQTSGANQQRMLREIMEALEQLSSKEPLILVLEDLHWSDSATLDLLLKLAQRREPAQLMMLCSYRPVDAIIHDHPIRKLQLDLKVRGLCSEISLQALQANEVQQYLLQRLGESNTTQEQMTQIALRSGGHPLFMTHIANDIQDYKKDSQQITEALSNSVPASLRALIELQLSRLSINEQLVVEAASVSGVEFCAASVASATGLTMEAVEIVCERLIKQQHFLQDAGVIAWPDGTVSGNYRFRHALYEQTLLERLVASRLVRMHRQIAERMELAYGKRSPEIAAELTQHFEASGLHLKAAVYCMHSARTALRRFSPEQTLAHAEHGLRLLSKLESGADTYSLELSLHLLAAFSLQAQHGYTHSAIPPHLKRIENLLVHIEDPGLLESALAALWMSYHLKAEFNEALSHAEETLQLGTLLHNDSLTCAGLARSSISYQMLGQFIDADRLSQSAMKLVHAGMKKTEGNEYNPACAALGSSAQTRWMIGYPDLALQRAKQAITCIQADGNTFVECLAHMSWLNITLLYLRDFAALHDSCTQLIALCERHNAREALTGARIQISISRCFRGEPDTGLPQLRQALEDQRALGIFNLPIGHMHEALCCMQLGRIDEARTAVDRGLAIVNQHNLRVWETELLRMDGELLLLEQPKNISAGEKRLLETLEINQKRGALSLELRTAMSLGRLWQRQKKSAQAIKLLKPIYSRFTEGFETADLLDAKDLLAKLGSKR